MIKQILSFVVAFPLVLLAAVSLSALFALPVQWLINYLIPGTVYYVTFKQAWALSLLCSLLFKSSK